MVVPWVPILILCCQNGTNRLARFGAALSYLVLSMRPDVRLRLVPLYCVAAVFLEAVFLPCDAQEIQRKRVAVLDFEDYSGSNVAAAKVFGADIGDLGRGVSAEIIVKLKASGKYTVIDQSALKQLLAEEDRSEDDHLDAYGRAAKFGRMLGLDAMIVGAITRFGPDDVQKGTNHSGLSTRKSKAYVDITARILGMARGEVLAEFKATGESSRSGEVMQVTGRGQTKTSPDILGNEFTDSLLQEATRNALTKIAADLDSFAPKIPNPAGGLEALVAEVAGDSITLNVVRKSGWNVGDRLSISRELPAPDNLKAEGSSQTVKELIGEATISEVADSYLSAIVRSSKEVHVGDRVRRISDERAP